MELLLILIITAIIINVLPDKKQKTFKPETFFPSTIRLSLVSSGIMRTTNPDERFSFNQVQASNILRFSGDIRKFNEFCGSSKMSQEEIDKCLNSIKLSEIGLLHQINN